MNDLKNLLDLAADGDRTTDGSDLGRAHHARSLQRRRRYSTGVAALGLVAIAGVGGAIAVGSAPDESPQGRTTTASPSTAAVRLVAQTLEATPYTFDVSPEGWSVQAVTPSAVTIVPDDGSTSDDANDFQGKLTILFDANPLEGEEVVSDGRTFWIGSSSGYTMMATPTLAGEPEGVVRIQFPKSAGWTRDTMLQFLGSVHVGDGAEQGVG